MTKVLIVDDNQVLTSLIRELLEEMNDLYRVETAGNGMDGYKAFLRFKPDIILTDIEMPGKNGLEMMRDIRKHDPLIRTIYMSASAYRYRSYIEEERKRYNAFLLDKPFTSDSMICLLNEDKEKDCNR